MTVPPKLLAVQGLRAGAALGVALAHFHNAFLQEGGDTAMGVFGFGVDLFFVISGFIMVHVSAGAFGRRGAALAFLSRRLIRIVPLYWLCSLLFLHYVLTTQTLTQANTDLPHILASFVFLPWPRPAGGMTPLLDVGWTLNYEMFFYVCFAAALTLPRRFAMPALGAGMLGLIAATRAWGWPSPLSWWASNMVLEFLMGVALAAARPGLPRVAGPVAALLVAAGVALACGGYFLAGSVFPPFTPATRPVVWGGGAVLMVAGATLWRHDLRGRIGAVCGVLGDASYAIYLLHPLVLYHALEYAGQQRLHGIDVPVRTWPAVGLMMAATTLLAILVHRGLERPVGRRLTAALPGLLAAPRPRPA